MSSVRRLDNAPWLKIGPAARVLTLLNGDGEEARVVGGAVRNALLDLPIGDVDIATTAPPDEVTRRAKAANIKVILGTLHRITVATTSQLSLSMPLCLPTARRMTFRWSIITTRFASVSRRRVVAPRPTIRT